MFKKINLIKFAAVLIASSFILQGCYKFKDYFHHGGSEKKTITEIVEFSPDYKLLKLALEKTELTDALDAK
jgi:hypothetical protein